jgi:hypothetical protein
MTQQRMSVLEEREMACMQPPRRRAWLEACVVAVVLAIVVVWL